MSWIPAPLINLEVGRVGPLQRPAPIVDGQNRSPFEVHPRNSFAVTGESAGQFDVVVDGGETLLAAPGNIVGRISSGSPIPPYRARLAGSHGAQHLLAYRPSSGFRYRDRDAVLDINDVVTFSARMLRPWRYNVHDCDSGALVFAARSRALAASADLSPPVLAALLLFHYSGLPFATSRWAYVQI